MSVSKIWVVENKVSGTQERGYTLDPRIHGFDGFEFDRESHEIVAYVPQQRSIPVAVIQDIEGKIRTFAKNLDHDMDRKYLLRLADMIDKAILEHSA